MSRTGPIAWGRTETMPSHVFPFYAIPGKPEAYSDDGHDLDGDDCWCGPQRQVICPDCGDDVPIGCWRCQGEGWVDAGPVDRPDLVIHHVVAMPEAR